MKQSTLCLISALGGAMVGAAIALLTTPHSGKELRGRIYDALNHMAEHGCCGHHHCDQKETAPQGEGAMQH